jgi:hypothetical protein
VNIEANTIGGATSEKSPSSAQLDDARRRQVVMARIRAQEDVFRRQGRVVATRRSRGGRTFGPYFRLEYRDAGGRHSIYLGHSAELADEVRSVLADLQASWHERRDWKWLRRESKRALREHKKVWARELGKLGFYLKGYEVRGWDTGIKGLIAANVAEAAARWKRKTRAAKRPGPRGRVTP